MVSTRHHPRQFPEPTSPTPRSTRGTPAKSSDSPPASSPTSPISSAIQSVSKAMSSTVTPAKSPTRTGAPRGRRRSTKSLTSYAHVADPIVVLWLFISLPLVIWDFSYCLLRPWSMPGGSLHSPVWSPYALYGTVDYIYGWPAWNDGVGFTAAQSSLNVVETLMYGYYLYVLATRGEGSGWYKFWEKDFWTEKAVVQGEGVAAATVICFASACMTLSKTVLYLLNEHFSKYENVGHNPFSRLVLLWIIPNGAWVIVPTYMCYALAREIVAAMHVAKTSGLEKED